MTDLKKDVKKNEDVEKSKNQGTKESRSTEPQLQLLGHIPIVFARTPREVAEILSEHYAIVMILIFLRMIKDSSVTERLRDLIRRRGAELTVEEVFAEIEKAMLEMQASKLF